MWSVLDAMAQITRHRTTFEEVAVGYTEAQAIAAALRCRLCENPTCVEGCPVEVDIPGFIGAVQRADFAEAARILKRGGKIVVLELMPHDEQWVKERLGHFHLGFEPDRLDLRAVQAQIDPDVISAQGIDALADK